MAAVTALSGRRPPTRALEEVSLPVLTGVSLHTVAGALGQYSGGLGVPAAHVLCFLCLTASLRTREGEELEMQGAGDRGALRA